MMNSPPKPGAVLAQYLGGLSLADAAAKIGIGQEYLSNLISGDARIDLNLARKLSRALATSPELWVGLQSTFDAWFSPSTRRYTGKHSHSDKFNASLDLMGPTGPVITNEPDDEMSYWDNIPPVGREFGSPDYERLEELDNLAYKAKGSLLDARRWLDTPHQELGGFAPEEVTKTPEGFARVKSLLIKSQ